MRLRSDITRSFAARAAIVVVAATLAAGGTAVAEPAGEAASDDVASPDFVPPSHPMFKAGGVTVDEKVGSVVPLHARFRTQDGEVVTLGEVLRGELPTILTFNYSDCPMLCSLQLNGLSKVLPELATPVELAGTAGGGQADDQADDKKVKFELGAQFRVVTIDLEPSETLEKTAKMRDSYIARLPEAQQAAAREGWTYLIAATPGDDAAIRDVADAVGFRYMWVKERAEWAHPAALIFLSTAGVVTRYVYGIEFDPQVMRESIVKAGLAEPATAVGFMNRCYHFDPDASSSARAGVLALRLGAVGFLVLLASGLGVVHVRRRRRAPGES